MVTVVNVCDKQPIRYLLVSFRLLRLRVWVVKHSIALAKLTSILNQPQLSSIQFLLGQKCWPQFWKILAPPHGPEWFLNSAFLVPCFFFFFLFSYCVLTYSKCLIVMRENPLGILNLYCLCQWLEIYQSQIISLEQRSSRRAWPFRTILMLAYFSIHHYPIQQPIQEQLDYYFHLILIKLKYPQVVSSYHSEVCILETDDWFL